MQPIHIVSTQASPNHILTIFQDLVLATYQFEIVDISGVVYIGSGEYKTIEQAEAVAQKVINCFVTITANQTKEKKARIVSVLCEQDYYGIVFTKDEEFFQYEIIDRSGAIYESVNWYLKPTSAHSDLELDLKAASKSNLLEASILLENSCPKS